MTPAEEWARCRPWIVAALEHSYGTHSIEDIEEGIASGEFQFWPGAHGAVITEVNHYPRMSVCNVVYVGGDLASVMDEIAPEVEAWAKTQGCTRMATVGRIGLERALPRHGFKRVHVVMVKEF